jgi:predicted enzyme related to lactoylglutathione lyase
MSDPDRLIHVELHVSNLEASVRFYRDIFEIPLHSDQNQPADDVFIGGQHAAFSWTEGAFLHFALFPAMPPGRPVTRGAAIGILVADAASFHSKLVKTGVRVLHEPRQEPWGLTARYLDPDGNSISITSR